jgi:hypothetical protein
MIIIKNIVLKQKIWRTIMSISVGGIDLVSSAINTELRLGVLEKLVEHLIQYVPHGEMDQNIIEDIRKKTFEELKKKYPESGLTYTSK